MLGLARVKSRLQYLDWLRGLAVVFMIQVHVFDSFLQINLRTTGWYRFSQFLGGLAAPLFLFTAGISIALVFDRLREKNEPTGRLIEKAFTRTAWILMLAYAFRIEQVVTWYPYADWSDVLKVDILNCIAISSLMTAIVAAFTRDRTRNAAVLVISAIVVILLAPVVALAPAGLPSIVLAYLNGNGRLDYFMLFPWAGYTFDGAAAGYLLLEARKRDREYAFMLWAAVAGVALFLAGQIVNRHPEYMFGLASYTRISPHYIFQKIGYILILIYGAYRWSNRKNAGQWSPLIIFGQTSLLVYWIHIEFVYGRLRMFQNTLDLELTAAQLLWLFPLVMWIANVRVRSSRRLARSDSRLR